MLYTPLTSSSDLPDSFDLRLFQIVENKGEGQNYENQNVENQKELRKPCKPSQRQKELLKRSERRKANFQNVEKS
jgi:hypothetical protein